MGGDKIESIINRIRDKETIVDLLEKKLENIQTRLLNDNDIDNITSQVKQLLGDFDNIIGNANTQEKKQLLSLFIEQIQIKRVSEEAVFYIRKLPTVNRKLDISLLSVRRVAEEGLEPPTRGL